MLYIRWCFTYLSSNVFAWFKLVTDNSNMNKQLKYLSVCLALRCDLLLHHTEYYYIVTLSCVHYVRAVCTYEYVYMCIYVVHIVYAYVPNILIGISVFWMKSTVLLPSTLYLIHLDNCSHLFVDNLLYYFFI